MKILIIANDLSGLIIFRGLLLSKLSELGHKLLALCPVNDSTKELEKSGVVCVDVPVDRRGINPVKDLRLFIKYYKIIKSEKPDLVITYTVKPNVYGGIAARILEVSYVANITGLGSAFEREGLIKNTVSLLYRVALKRAKVVFFENRCNRDYFVNERIVSSHQTRVLNGAGVDLIKYQYQKYPSDGIFRFLFIGRIMKEKGIDELLEAMKLLQNEGCDCCLDLVGGLEENYQQQIEMLEKEGWLKYYGIQKDVRPFIAASHCFVLPSWHEGMANTNLEAAASGRPIITSNIPGCKEAVIDNISGFLCEPRDVNSLCQAMKKIIGCSYLKREEMGKKGRDYIQRAFDKEKIVRETIDALMQ